MRLFLARREVKQLSIPVFLFAVWALVILIGYYYYHKPITIAQTTSVLVSLADIILATCVLAACGGLGRFLIPTELLSPLERAVLQAAIGMCAFSILWLLLGFLHLYSTLTAWAILVLPHLILRRQIFGWFSDIRKISDQLKSATRFEKLLALFATILVLLNLFVALAPPIKWDAMTYHLQLPRIYLASGSMHYVEHNPYWGHPELAEMLYLWSIGLFHAQTAATLGWSVGVLVLLGVIGFTNALFTPQVSENQREQAANPSTPVHFSAGWVAVVALLVGYTYRYMLGWSYIDLFSALYGLAALIMLALWIRTRDTKWFLWTGAICGMAISIKWTGGLLPVGIFLAALFLRKRFNLSWKHWVFSGLLALVVLLPWLTRNLIFSGNPIHPYFFPSKGYSPERVASANVPLGSFDWLGNLTLPIWLTWSGIDSAAGYSSDIGPLLVLLAIPGLLYYRKHPLVQVMTVCLGLAWLSISVLGWRFSHLGQPRLYFSMLPAMAVLAGLGWNKIRLIVSSGVRLRVLTSVIILLVLIFTLMDEINQLFSNGAANYLFGVSTEEEYLDNSLGWYSVANRELAALPPESKVMMLWEPRGFYAPLNAQPDPWLDRWRTDRREIGDSQQILSHWKQEGFTHLFLYKAGFEFMCGSDVSLLPGDCEALEEMVQSLPLEKEFSDVYALFRIP